MGNVCSCCCSGKEDYYTVLENEEEIERLHYSRARSRLHSNYSLPLSETLPDKVKQVVVRFMSEILRGEDSIFNLEKRRSSVSDGNDRDTCQDCLEALKKEWRRNLVKILFQEAVVTLWYKRSEWQYPAFWDINYKSQDVGSGHIYTELLKYELLQSFRRFLSPDLMDSRKKTCADIIHSFPDLNGDELPALLQSVSWDEELEEVYFQEAVQCVWYTYPVLRGCRNILGRARRILSPHSMKIQEMIWKHYFETNASAIAIPSLDASRYEVTGFTSYTCDREECKATWKTVVHEWTFEVREIMFQENIMTLWLRHPGIHNYLPYLNDSKWFSSHCDDDEGNVCI